MAQKNTTIEPKARRLGIQIVLGELSSKSPFANKIKIVQERGTLPNKMQKTSIIVTRENGAEAGKILFCSPGFDEEDIVIKTSPEIPCFTNGSSKGLFGWVTVNKSLGKKRFKPFIERVIEFTLSDPGKRPPINVLAVDGRDLRGLVFAPLAN